MYCKMKLTATKSTKQWVKSDVNWYEMQDIPFRSRMHLSTTIDVMHAAVGHWGTGAHASLELALVC